MIHLTVGEIITSIILYTIVHGCIWVARNAERFVVTHADNVLRLHVLSGHRQKAGQCDEGRCNELAAVSTIDAITL